MKSVGVDAGLMGKEHEFTLPSVSFRPDCGSTEGDLLTCTAPAATLHLFQ